MRKFSDFAEENINLPGDKLSPQEVFNKQIVVTAARILESKVVKDKDCLQLQFYFLDDEEKKPYVMFSTSTVLTRQARQYAEQIPFQTTIITCTSGRNKYHSFS